MNMNAHLLTRRTHRVHPSLKVVGELSLPLARAHEICGAARHMLAMLIAGAMEGPVFWITPAWQPEQLNPDGMLALAAPQRFTFISATRAEDILWSLEEVLRSGAVPLAVAELPGLPGMTAVRRLHLAAETGAAEGSCAPLGLMLTPGEGGAPGIETRWHMAQAHRPGAAGWTLSRRRARTLPPKSWALTGRPGKWHLSGCDADVNGQTLPAR